MQSKKLFMIFVIIGVVAVIVSGIALTFTQPVHAQCGSQASSCKNCHEVQAQDPVNADGTGWHTGHAFGDFCYICHAGNNQATEKDAAHAGMVPPMSDVNAACQQCHPNDLQERAQVYATALGVEIGSGNNGGTPSTGTGSQKTAVPSNAQVDNCSPATTDLAVDDPNLVDYTQRYNEIVLGKHPTNWGNTILTVLIAAMVLGGGYFVLRREGLFSISFRETKPVEGEYPADVVDMLPEIAKLKPATRRSLRRLLEKPENITELSNSPDKPTKDDSSNEKD
jgi:hypothetical protein